MKYLLHIPIFLTLVVTSISCQAVPSVGDSLELATSTENHVEVTIKLERGINDNFFLSATFTPQSPSLHLYSKDIPKTGVDGLGRPTLLELSSEVPLQALSELSESVSSEVPVTPPFELLTYPAGPVTLSLPVLLPEGNSWSDGEVIVTYMACDDQGCRPPVENKSIAIKIPGRDLFQSKEN